MRFSRLEAFLSLKTLAVLAGCGALALAACGDSNNGTAFVAGGADGGDEGGSVVDEGGTTSETGAPDPTPGCGATGVTPGVSTQTLTADGAKRTFELFVPDTYDNKKSFPLVFVFHGDGGDGAGIRGSFKLEAEAAGGAIFVYPDGENQTWDIDTASGLGHDIAFIDAIVTKVSGTHCVDKKRIVPVGFSKGAYFVNMLACLAKSSFAGVVAHSGGGPFGVDGSGTDFDGQGNLICPRPPIPAMQIIGDADGLLGDAQQARDYWKRLNTCKGTTTAFAPSPCVAYDGCNAARPEIYCQIPGMGHSIWSNATKATWTFIKSR
jgi:polyhydroxybutyrate depolymerase